MLKIKTEEYKQLLLDSAKLFLMEDHSASGDKEVWSESDEDALAVYKLYLDIEGNPFLTYEQYSHLFDGQYAVYPEGNLTFDQLTNEP